MAIPRTSLLDLPLPVTGSLSGDWGAATNNGLTEYLDIAVAGSLVLNTDADVTLTSTDGDENGTNIGSTTAQYAILRWTATGSTTRNITVPAKSKTYIVINATGGTQSIVLRGAGPTTGVTIVAGEKAVCAWNGSDFVKVGGAAGGSNTQVQYNNNGVFGGSADLTWDGSTLATTGLTASGAVTLSATSQNIALGTSQVGGTWTAGGASQTGAITLDQSTKTHTLNIGTGATENALTKTINLGTAGVSGSTTAINIGSAVSGATTNVTLNGTVQPGVVISGSSSGDALRITQTGAGNALLVEDAANPDSTPFVVTAAGNVGIGTSSPTAAKLHVDFDGTALRISRGSSIGFLYNTGTAATDITRLQSDGGSVQLYTTGGTATLDSSGNLGLGVTPSAWGGGKAFEVGNVGNAFWGVGTADIRISANAYFDGTFQNKYGANGYATRYDQTAGVHKWYTAPSGTAGNAITFTQAMTLDASGNLLVGTTTATSALTVEKGVNNATNGLSLVNNNGSDGNGSAVSFYGAFGAPSQTTQLLARINGFVTDPNGAKNGNIAFFTGSGGTVTERARITSGGDLTVGSTSAGNAGTINVSVGSPGTTAGGLQLWASTSQTHVVQFGDGTSGTDPYRGYIEYSHSDDSMRFGTTSTERARINSDGYLLVGYTASNGAYKLQVNSQIFATSATIATSDGRYKENVTSLAGALDIVKALNPVQFTWKQHPVHNFDRSCPTIGFIAQEVQQVLADKPYLNSIIKKNECEIEPAQYETVVLNPAVDEVKDDEGNIIVEAKEAVTEQRLLKEAVKEDFYGIAEGNMIAILTKALQESTARIEQLEAKVAALEGTQP